MPHVATQVANLLWPVRGCPPCPGGMEHGLCSPAARPGSEGAARDQHSAIVLFPPINQVLVQKVQACDTGSSRTTALAEAKTNRVLEMPNWFISTFSEGNIEFWRARSLGQLSNFPNAEKRETVAHASLETQYYILVFTALVWVGY